MWLAACGCRSAASSKPRAEELTAHAYNSQNWAYQARILKTVYNNMVKMSAKIAVAYNEAIDALAAAGIPWANEVREGGGWAGLTGEGNCTDVLVGWEATGEFAGVRGASAGMMAGAGTGFFSRPATIATDQATPRVRAHHQLIEEARAEGGLVSRVRDAAASVSSGAGGKEMAALKAYLRLKGWCLQLAEIDRAHNLTAAEKAARLFDGSSVVMVKAQDAVVGALGRKWASQLDATSEVPLAEQAKPLLAAAEAKVRAVITRACPGPLAGTLGGDGGVDFDAVVLKCGRDALGILGGRLGYAVHVIALTGTKLRHRSGQGGVSQTAALTAGNTKKRKSAWKKALSAHEAGDDSDLIQFRPNPPKLSSRAAADLHQPPIRATAAVCRRPLGRRTDPNAAKN